jgi:hypothetical protein
MPREIGDYAITKSAARLSLERSELGDQSVDRRGPFDNPTWTWPGNFTVTHKTLPFDDVLECLLDLREDL